MSKKIKIVLIILLVLIICVYIVLLIKTQKKKTLYDEIEFPEEALETHYNELKRVQNKTDYFIVMECLNKYYSKYLTDEEFYNLIDEKYLKDNNLNISDIVNKYKKNNKSLIDVTDMYVAEIGRGVRAYFCYGYSIDKKTNQKEDLKLIVKVDNKIKTFSVLPYEYLSEKGYLNIDETTNLDFSEETEIKDKNSNKYVFRYINDEDYVKKLFSNYINRSLFNDDVLYQHLDKEYSENRFQNINDFKKYIDFKRKTYETFDYYNAKKIGDFSTEEEYEQYIMDYKPLSIESYKKTQTENYTQYVVIDNLGNYYIFREKYTMNYSIILDTYSVELPEFIEKYENANEKEKAVLNTKKFIDSLNDKNFEYAYSCLANQFKENKFNTLKDFEEYIEIYFFERSNFEFLDFKNEGEIYIFTIKISDANKLDNGERMLQVIMKLGEKRTFEMSFNME